MGRSATAILALTRAEKQALGGRATGAGVSAADVFDRLPFDGQIAYHMARKALWEACDTISPIGKRTISDGIYVRYLDEVIACRTNQDAWSLVRKSNGEMFMLFDRKVQLVTDLCQKARGDKDGYAKDRDGLVAMAGVVDNVKTAESWLKIFGFMEDRGDFDNMNVAAVYDYRDELRAKYVESSE